MRVVLFIVVTLVMAVLIAGSGILLITQTPDPGPWLWVGSVGAVGAIVTPLGLGSVLAFWGAGRSPGARRVHRRGLLVAVSVEALAIVFLCVFAALTGAPWWVVALHAGAAAVLTAAAVALGPILQRGDADPPQRSGAAYSRGDLRRDVRRILLASGVTLVVTAAAVGVVMGALREADSIGLFVYAPVLAVMVGGIVCVFVTRRVAREIRGLVGGDVDRARLIGRVVVRGKSAPLSPEDEAVAPRFAALSSVVQVYQATWLGCLYVALGAQQIMRIVDDPGDVFSWSLLIFFAVAVVAFGPIIVIQLRRTRRYAIEHGETILEPRESTTARPA